MVDIGTWKMGKLRYVFGGGKMIKDLEGSGEELGEKREFFIEGGQKRSASKGKNQQKRGSRRVEKFH